MSASSVSSSSDVATEKGASKNVTQKISCDVVTESSRQAVSEPRDQNSTPARVTVFEQMRATLLSGRNGKEKTASSRSPETASNAVRSPETASNEVRLPETASNAVRLPETATPSVSCTSPPCFVPIPAWKETPCSPPSYSWPAASVASPELGFTPGGIAFDYEQTPDLHACLYEPQGESAPRRQANHERGNGRHARDRSPRKSFRRHEDLRRLQKHARSPRRHSPRRHSPRGHSPRLRSTRRPSPRRYSPRRHSPGLRSPQLRSHRRPSPRRYSPRRHSPRRQSPNPLGRDSGAPVGQKVFIGNFSQDTEEYDLEKTFGKFGPLSDVFVPIEPPLPGLRTGARRGFGFVTFIKERHAAAAVDAMNNREWRGRVLRVEFAKQRQDFERHRRRFFSDKHRHNGSRGRPRPEQNFGSTDQYEYQSTARAHALQLPEHVSSDRLEAAAYPVPLPHDFEFKPIVDVV